MDDDRQSSEQLANRLRFALVMNESGYDMMRMQVHRRFPEADSAEIERRFRDWMQERPGAEQGDGVGRVVSWPRTAR